MIRLQEQTCAVMWVWAIKDRTAVVASYHIGSRNPFRFKALANINSKSYHLTALGLVNILRKIYFPSSEYIFSFERSEVNVAVVCCVVFRNPANHAEKTP